MNILIFALLAFIAAMLCALVNFIVRQQELALEPSLEQPEEDQEPEEEE